MSIRITGSSESMGGADKVANMVEWSLDVPASAADAAFIRNIPKHTTVLDESQYPLLKTDKSRATFIEDDELGLGRDDSRHEVRFGQMILNTHFEYESPDLVAVKPFDRPKDLQREWAASTYINGISEEQRAFLPLGIWRQEDGTLNLLSLYEHGVKSFDSVFWADKNISPEALRPSVIDQAAIFCIYSVGLLHGLGVAHGDAQVKNLAKDNRHIRFIDLEGASLLPRDGNVILEDAATDHLAMKDLTFLFDSSRLIAENMEHITDAILFTENAARFARKYRKGLRDGAKESGFVLPKMITTTPEYFESLINM